jgi:hypothetical protein
MAENIIFPDFFSNGKFGGHRVHSLWTGQRGSGPRWTEVVQTRGRDGALPTRGRSGSLVLSGGGGGGRAGRGGVRGVLTGARAVMERRHDGGEERQRLELGVRVKEGSRELGREGKRGQ